MIVNHELRFIFFHVPKTAGTSFRLALSGIPGSVNIGKPTKHLTPAEIGKVLPPEKVVAAAGYFSFCFVRDPWERFGSLHRFLFLKHRDRYKVPEDLNDFVKALAERRGKLQPPIDDIEAYWTPQEKLHVHGMLRYAFAGSPESVRRDLDAFTAMTGVDELMVVSHIYDHAARLRSYELLSEIWQAG